jgi:UMF1 family MFS transporter
VTPTGKPASATLAPGVERREVVAWTLYDFANSGYTTVVVTAVFSAYFVSVVAEGADWATLAWTAALSVSYAAAIVLGPLLGAHVDRRASKKTWLGWTTAGCVLGTAGLALVGPGDMLAAVLLVALSCLCFSLGENLIAAFLPELARPEAIGRLSGWGWAVGYLGGLIALALCLAWISSPGATDDSAQSKVAVCMLITAALFALASLPVFLFLRERAQPAPGGPPLAVGFLVGAAWHQLRASRVTLARLPELRRILVCITFAQAGVQTVVALAAIYAEQALGFETAQTVQMILLVNITAAIGAAAFGHVQDRLGHVRTLALTLLGWLVAIALAWASRGPELFWVAANVVGLCLGASQSAGRALVGLLAPVGQRAECFGLWGLAVKVASILGPLCYGLVSWAGGGDHRLAILVTGLFFVAALILLRGVDTGRGRARALEAGGAG